MLNKYSMSKFNRYIIPTEAEAVKNFPENKNPGLDSFSI